MKLLASAAVPVLVLILALGGCSPTSASEKPSSQGAARPLTQEERIAEIQSKAMPQSQKEALIRDIRSGQSRR